MSWFPRIQSQAPWLAAVGTVFLVACAAKAAPPPPPRGYAVVARFPHDTAAYTQGLLLESGGILLESTGRYGSSELRSVALKTGVADKVVPLPAERFGEGLARFENRLYQLTWQSQLAYVYDRATFALVDSIAYPGEGWGLTTDGQSLIMSDGSDTLRFVDPRTFAVRRRLPVRFTTGTPVGKLNELEYVGGEVFANVYQSDWILRIDAETGVVREVLDLAELLPAYNAAATSENVLNGIAYDSTTGHLLVTGKRWPELFELKLDRPPGAGRP